MDENVAGPGILECAMEGLGAGLVYEPVATVEVFRRKGNRGQDKRRIEFALAPLPGENFVSLYRSITSIVGRSRMHRWRIGSKHGGCLWFRGYISGHRPQYPSGTVVGMMRLDTVVCEAAPLSVGVGLDQPGGGEGDGASADDV